MATVLSTTTVLSSPAFTRASHAPVWAIRAAPCLLINQVFGILSSSGADENPATNYADVFDQVLWIEHMINWPFRAR